MAEYRYFSISKQYLIDNKDKLKSWFGKHEDKYDKILNMPNIEIVGVDYNGQLQGFTIYSKMKHRVQPIINAIIPNTVNRKLIMDQLKEALIRRVTIETTNKIPKPPEKPTPKNITIKNKNSSNNIMPKKRSKLSSKASQFVIEPASTKASCSAAESAGRTINKGARGGKFWYKVSRRSGKKYKVYCKG